MEDSHQRASAWFLSDTGRDRVRGYLQRTQAHALHSLLAAQRQHDVRGALAEIGVFCGKTLIGLARAARDDEPVLGVDPLVIGAHDLTPELTRNLRDNLQEAELSRVSVRRALSTQLDVLAWIRSLKRAARFVHLDGHHARETILHDLQLAASWLEPGGLVVIDDFLNELHPDLTSGILDGLAAHPQLEPLAVVPRMGHIEEGGSKLVCVTRGHAARYLEALDRDLGDHLRPWSDRMLGAEVRVYRSALPPAAQKPAAPGGSKPLPVVFALHDPTGRYWLNTAVAATSVASYASGPIHIHVLHDDTLTDAARVRLAAIGRDLRTEVTLTRVELPAHIEAKALRQFSPASAFRLLIPKLFPQEERVVYLDSDLVANQVDVCKLADAAPAGAPLSAVRDPHIGKAESHARELDRMGLDPGSYFNSGVLVFRPGAIGVDLLERFVGFLAENPTAIHPDQDFLNLEFREAAALDGAYNFQVAPHADTMMLPLADYSGKVLHYAGKIKPLEGAIAPGLIPFLMHSHATPEITQGFMYRPAAYLVPLDEPATTFRLQQI